MPRRVGSSSSMISMARTLGAPETVPAGKQAEGVNTIHVGPKPAAEGGDQMHNVGIVLNEFEPFYADRTVFGDAAEIIAAQVHEHDVFGALLGIGGELCGQPLVFVLVLAT